MDKKLRDQQRAAEKAKADALREESQRHRDPPRVPGPDIDLGIETEHEDHDD